ncbi:MAG: NAD(P)-binding domain-containing protein, partial [Terracoccus sp.]
MTKIVLLGAGGKMGVRLSVNLAKSDYEVAHVEVSEAGRRHLKEVTGLDCVEQKAALADADVVVLAVPDRLIGKVSHQLIGDVKSGAALIVLDAAAPYAGEMP